MAKRIKKAAVRPELCKQWLRRFEEAGESPPHIAEADGYDVRTVRKQIQQAMQEREMREARVMVLRNALEAHYKDLYTFAETLDSFISWPPYNISKSYNQHKMLQALREHLPRSPIWKAISRLDQLADQIDLCTNQIEERTKVWVEGRGINFAQTRDEPGMDERFLKYVVSHVLSKVKGEKGPKNDEEIFCERENNTGLYIVMIWGTPLAYVEPDDVAEVKAIYTYILNEAMGWEQADELQLAFSEFGRQSGMLRDELATIILKRIVPGRCRYCPI